MNEELDIKYNYHPSTEETEEIYKEIRESLKNAARVLNEFCPDSREKSLAHTKLEEARMWANASVARNIRPKED